MSGTVFEFRVCQNPVCGLRFPAPRGNRSGERCPICLGSTTIARETRAERESQAPQAPTSAGMPFHALIDNVRSALNVGSIFRSAEGYGVEHLYLCGITPAPDNSEVKKTALGAELMVPWSAHKNAVQLISSLKDDNFCVWALERTVNSKALEKVLKEDEPAKKLVLVVGNEQAGVDPEILDLADRVVHIEMHGRKGSFNVAVAFAIAAYVLARADN